MRYKITPHFDILSVKGLYALRSCFQLKLLLFEAAIFGRQAITWYFGATSSRLFFCFRFTPARDRTIDHSAQNVSGDGATSRSLSITVERLPTSSTTIKLQPLTQCSPYDAS